ncbi:TPA: hypothetical protein QDA74_003713 [Burkholderia territorii]|uniref:hypothetical protein n=1 Tax=Burkholderia territorii TaxID=1503055 RepID=UPI0011C866E0|nr:hypothetical protein [Burkholderia territorii]TXG07066.1 hypothetical protein FU139_25480 [Burkholderia territorii]HDR8859215.1 hypothetical protein [Burkholderia territorii]HDR8866200.1 hypothetical protein [Burkholderia territorii]HDR8872304.1 hypothetical protein [Burkholderia territorii]HDR8878202.1 hypothetical protein [Burkholderia territorii]
MFKNETLNKIWTDPVWSKVISNIISWGGPATAGLILAYAHFSTGALAAWLNKNSIPNFLVIVILIFAPIIWFIFRIKSKAPPSLDAPSAPSALSSNEWFDAIADRLSDCRSARIYLRSFEHPDNFREEHRIALMKIINNIKIKLQNNSDIKIISFHPTNDKSGLDWLKAELPDETCIAAIKIRKDQPVSNASSMYLFDDKTIAYNKRNDRSTSYHVENYANSIVHEMISRGFDDLAR